MEIVVTLTKMPLLTLKYTSFYTFSVTLLANMQMSIYLLNILNLGISSTPKKKKGNISATIA